MKLTSFIIYYIYIAVLLYLLLLILIIDVKINYISISNTLCYSWIASNKYEVRDRLCNINCTYVRKNKFPINIPFRCKDAFLSNSSKINNDIQKIYLFNTSTYGVNVKRYRFLYNETYV